MKQKRKAVDGEPTEPCAICGEMPRSVMRTEYGVHYWNCLCQNDWMYDALTWDEEQRRLMQAKLEEEDR
jgi:formate dehydrogenase maturation protein FdhE